MGNITYQKLVMLFYEAYLAHIYNIARRG